MSDASLLDEVRDLLSLPENPTPAEVLELARAKQAFWQVAAKQGKKIAREGAERQLRKLDPILPHLEAECELQELEAHVAGQRGPLRKHELKLRSSKLAAKLNAMADDDVRAVRLARLADVNESLSGPDDSELRDLENTIDGARERIPGAAAAGLSALGDELAALRGRIEKITKAGARADLDSRLKLALAALAARRETLEGEAVGAALQACAAKIPALSAAQCEPARLELEGLRPRIERVSETAGRAALQAGHRDAVAALALRRETFDAANLDVALNAAAEKIPALAPPQLEPMRAELETLRARIEKISEGAGRAALQAKHQQAIAELEARRASLARGELEAAVDAAVAKAATATGPAIATVRKELDELASRVAQLPEGPARAALEQKIQQAIRGCAQRRELFQIETGLSALAEARSSGEPPDKIESRCAELKGRISDLPDELRPSLEQKLREIFATHRADDEGTVPLPPPPSLEVGECLRLRPLPTKASSGRLPPLVFVARTRFVLGRFPTRADAQVAADFSCPPNMTKISREHAVLQRKGREILAHDAGTINGTWIPQQRLTSTPIPVHLAPPLEIVLGFGPVLTVVAQHLAAAAPEGPPIIQRQPSASFRSGAPSLLTGAVRFLPKPAMELPALVAWIFTDAAIGSAPTNAIVLPPEFPATLGRVHFWDGAFWLENTSPQAPVFFAPAPDREGNSPAPVPERPLAPNEVVPLHSGDALRLGAAGFTVEINP